MHMRSKTLCIIALAIAQLERSVTLLIKHEQTTPCHAMPCVCGIVYNKGNPYKRHYIPIPVHLILISHTHGPTADSTSFYVPNSSYAAATPSWSFSAAETDPGIDLGSCCRRTSRLHGQCNHSDILARSPPRKSSRS
jgi:hypothetical protein